MEAMINGAVMDSTESLVGSESDSNKKKRSKVKGQTESKAGNGKQKSQQVKGKQQGGKGNGDRPALNPDMFKVHGTVMRRSMRVGNQKLGRAFFQNWQGMTHALHYLTDYARNNIRGKVVQAANRGLSEYLSEKCEEAKRMLSGAIELAENNGVLIGEPGSVREEVVPVSCPSDTDVMELVKVLDEYVRVMDSLWMTRVINDKKRDDAHKDVVNVVVTLNRLLRKMTQKMVDYKRKKMGHQLKRSEEGYAEDIEQLVFDLTGLDIKEKRKLEVEAKAKPLPKKANAKDAPAEQDGDGEGVSTMGDLQAVELKEAA